MSDPFLLANPEVEGGGAPPRASTTLQLDVLADADKPKEWEARGTVLGVAVGVLATSGSHLAYLFAMFALMKTADDRLLSCERGEGIGLGSSGRILCDYTKAYLQCFPELALTICLLVIGRNLLQTRMYYGMLRQGAVLQYKSKNMFQDGLVRVFLWCYAHSIMHLLLLMYIIWHGGRQDDFFEELRETKGGRQKHGEQFFLGLSHAASQPVDGLKHPIHDQELRQDIAILVELVGFFIIPATLFLIYLFTSYDLEGSLVPLSQYFYDARASTAGWCPKARCELMVIDDDAARLIVTHYQDRIHESSESVDEAYRELIKLYLVEGEMWERRATSTGQSFIGISRAHWPARLLISEDATDISNKGFRAVWIAFIVIAVVLQLFMMVSLFTLVVSDWADAREHRSAYFHLMVVLANICVEAFGMMVNMHSLTQWVHHDWFRRDREKTWNSGASPRKRTPETVGDQPIL